MPAEILRKEPFQYETLKFGARLEIDRRGIAVFRRRQRIRFLEDGVSVFFDRAWGEGVLFANYDVSPLRILNAIPSRKGYVIALALPRPFRKGEVLDLDLGRRIIGSFLEDEMYWETSLDVPTELLSIDVAAPRALRFRHPEIAAPPRGEFDAADTPTRLQLRVRQPVSHAPYRLSWSWK